MSAAALDAVARGRAALRAGERVEAVRWLDRAHRLAPGDRSVALLLASAFTGVDDAHGRSLLRALVAEAPELRDAAVALVLAELRLGDAAEAARRLGRLLRAVAPSRDAAFARLAAAVARASGSAGWIGADSRGRLLVCAQAGALAPDDLRATGGRVDLAVDGVPAGGVAADGTPRVRTLAADRVGLVTATCDGRALLGSGLDLAALRRPRGAAWLEPDGSLSGWAWLPGDPDRAPALEVLAPDAAGATLRLQIRAVAELSGGDGSERRRGFRVAASRLAGARTIRVAGADGTALTGSPLCCEAARPAGRIAAQPRAVPARRAVDVVMPVHRGEADFSACLATLLRRRADGLRIVVVDDASPDPALRAAAAAAAARGEVVLLRHEENRGFPAAANTGLRHARGAAGADGVAVDGVGANGAGAGEPRDVVLLNPDTLLPEGWLARLAAAAYGGGDVGSATPMTDDGSILSYADAPSRAAGLSGAAGNPAPPDRAAVARLDRLDALFRAANGGDAVALPTGVGFCMMLRHDCLAEVGLLREDVFAQGYGEENDWCLRAARLGWRHVAATGLFVSHRGGASFGAARRHLLSRNLAVLNRLHPGYDDLVQRFEAADPLAAARRRVDRLRWAAGRRAGAVVLVTHALGGGVERHLRERTAAIQAEGLRAVVLRPAAATRKPAAESWETGSGAPGSARPGSARSGSARSGSGGAEANGPEPGGPEPGEARAGGRACAVSDGVEDAFADLRFELPREMAALARLLGRDGVRRVELHHLLGHAPEIAGLAESLGVPCDVVVHDYAAWCPRVSLCGAGGRYCGEPVDEATCEDCVADLGSRLDEWPGERPGERIGVAELRARSGRMLRAARRVVAPSADAAERIARQFPGVAAVVAPWEDDPGPPDPAMRAAAGHAAAPAGAAGGTMSGGAVSGGAVSGGAVSGGAVSGGAVSGGAAAGGIDGGRGVRVLVMGAIGVEKGYDVLLGCVRDAGRRGLPLSFVVAGHTMDDSRLLDAGPVFVTGRYEEHEAVALARRQSAQLGFVPSVWPETWCYALSELWRAGLPVAAFALGAQAERIRRAGRGVLLPPGLPAGRVNDALLQAGLQAGLRTALDAAGAQGAMVGAG